MDSPDIHRQSDANIRRFEEYLSNHPDTNRDTNSRVYELFLDPRTGEFKFPVNIGHLENNLPFQGRGTLKRDWVLIHLRVNETTSPHRVEFTILNAQNQQLEPKKLEPLCQKVLTQTLQVLNQKGTQISDARSTLPGEFQVLAHIPSGETPREYRAEREFEIRNISRKEAEKTLKKQPRGTYLLRREDDLDRLIEHNLSIANGKRVSLYTVSYVDKDGNMSELMVVKTSQGWTRFNDDPLLTGAHYTYYPSLPQLLAAEGITRRLQQ